MRNSKDEERERKKPQDSYNQFDGALFIELMVMTVYKIILEFGGNIENNNEGQNVSFLCVAAIETLSKKCMYKI